MSLRILRRWNVAGLGGAPPTRIAWAQFDDVPRQLDYLRRMVEVYRMTPFARALALQIIRDASVKDHARAEQAIAIAEWVKNNIRYVNELPETFQTPPKTVELGAGDCDDHTTLIGSLCENLGIPVEVVGMKVNGVWQHVFPRAIVQAPGGALLRMPLDSTIKNTRIRDFVDPVAKLRAQGKKIETYIPHPLDG